MNDFNIKTFILFPITNIIWYDYFKKKMESAIAGSRNLSYGKLLCILSNNLSILYSNNRAMIKFMSESLVHKAFDIYQVIMKCVVHLLYVK